MAGRREPHFCCADLQKFMIFGSRAGRPASCSHGPLGSIEHPGVALYNATQVSDGDGIGEYHRISALRSLELTDGIPSESPTGDVPNVGIPNTKCQTHLHDLAGQGVADQAAEWVKGH